jgi:hypothetical protein
MPDMTRPAIQEQCERGQELLMRTDYVQAESVLASAEAAAWDARDYDSLARLYMPLQEARRQRRQRCSEGVVRLDIIARQPDDVLDAAGILDQHPHGQLLVAGWQSTRPAGEVRRLARQRGLYVEVLLAMVRPGDPRSVVVHPREEDAADSPGGIIVPVADLPAGPRRGDWHASSQVMGLWERLHAPFMAAADIQVDPVQRMEGYRKVIRIDYACELAHQRIADVARGLAKEG